jgi:hypothetical protein
VLESPGVFVVLLFVGVSFLLVVVDDVVIPGVVGSLGLFGLFGFVGLFGSLGFSEV